MFADLTALKQVAILAAFQTFSYSHRVVQGPGLPLSPIPRTQYYANILHTMKKQWLMEKHHLYKQQVVGKARASPRPLKPPTGPISEK